MCEHRFYKAEKKQPYCHQDFGSLYKLSYGIEAIEGGKRKQSLGYPRSILGIARYVGISAFQETEMGDVVEVTVRATVTPDGEFDT